MRRLAMACSAAALALAALAGPTAAAGPVDSATRVWEVGGSNMGLCSAFLGGMQVRDDQPGDPAVR